MSPSEQTSIWTTRTLIKGRGLLPSDPINILRKTTMNHTITGRFDTRAHADIAASLISRFIPSTKISVAGQAFLGYVTIDEPVIVSDRQDGDDDDDDETASGSLGTAIAAGVAAGAGGTIAGPVVALAAAGAEVYVGSLVSALNGLEDHAPHAALTPSADMPSGITVSVRVDNALHRSRVIDSLRANGASEVAQIDAHPIVAPQVADSGYN